MPAFILAGEGIPFHGIPAAVPDAAAEKLRDGRGHAAAPETRELFMKAVEALRAAGADVIVDDAILPASFARTASRVATYAYMQDGTTVSSRFGPAEYRLGRRVPEGGRLAALRLVDRRRGLVPELAASASINGGSTPIPTRSATITRRDGRRSRPISSRSIV